MLDCQPAVVCCGEAGGLWGELMGGNPPPVPVGVVGLLENPDPPVGKVAQKMTTLHYVS